jgi:putative flavoprotein involved in K+ transport
MTAIRDGRLWGGWGSPDASLTSGLRGENALYLPGLYFLAFPWQHTRGSALLSFVGDAAAHVVRAVLRHPAPASVVGTTTHPVPN